MTDRELGVAQEERLFNSTLETATRTLIVLDAMHGSSCDLTTLTWLDYLVVHSGDVGGPPSLHPPLPYRSGELVVRRPTIESGLSLLRRLGLVALWTRANGIEYGVTDQAYPLIQMMRSAYALALRERASWLSEYYSRTSASDLEALISDQVGSWTAEFSSSRESGEARE